MSDDLRERLAALAHEQWSGWWRYHLAKCTVQPDGTLVLPAGYAAALLELTDTPYDQLSGTQKDLDRAEADKVLALLEVRI